MDRANIAINERAKHRVSFEELTNALGSKVTKPWEEMVEEWEKDQSKPNPFEGPPEGM